MNKKIITLIIVLVILETMVIGILGVRIIKDKEEVTVSEVYYEGGTPYFKTDKIMIDTIYPLTLMIGTFVSNTILIVILLMNSRKNIKIISILISIIFFISTFILPVKIEIKEKENLGKLASGEWRLYVTGKDKVIYKNIYNIETVLKID